MLQGQRAQHPEGRPPGPPFGQAGHLCQQSPHQGVHLAGRSRRLRCTTLPPRGRCSPKRVCLAGAHSQPPALELNSRSSGGRDRGVAHLVLQTLPPGLQSRGQRERSCLGPRKAGLFQAGSRVHRQVGKGPLLPGTLGVLGQGGWDVESPWLSQRSSPAPPTSSVWSPQPPSPLT